MKRKLWVCCAALAALTACSKKDKDNQPAAATKYLSTMTEQSNGLSSSYTLTYDGSNRLTAYVEKEAGAVTTSRQLTYDAAGKLVKLTNDHPEEDTYEEYTFMYDAAGAPKNYIRKISDDDGLETTINGAYTITNGKVMRITETDMDPENHMVINMDFTYAGHNVTRVSSTVNGGQGLTSVVEVTHGGKKNPLHPGLQLPYAMLADLALETYSENEIISIRSYIGNTLQMAYTNTYRYDADGYPVSSEQHEEGSGEVTKTTYQYR